VKNSKSTAASNAVRELRHALDMTQQEFAVQLGLALPTIARYETDRTPKGKVLSEFLRLAEQKNRADLAAIFRRELNEQLGDWIAEKVVAARTATITPTALRAVRALLDGIDRDLDALVDPQYAPSLAWQRAKERLAKAKKYCSNVGAS
jgi:transcriptional regulator with XRE-family HTH domain